ncbi:MAG TPA: S8 family serine peptidase [bacterium]|nr:S8 family serine peptidase [bacterium]HQG45359.1 S8 family serine peptidase [bacterium]HQJ63418.1 S8 family serine peptidase [bacterium]
MRRLLYLIALFIFFMALSAALRSPQDPGYLTDELLVRFKPAVTTQAVSSLAATVQARAVAVVPVLRMYRLRLIGTISVEEALGRLRALDQVELAEPNYRVSAFGTPNDPSFSKQWGLHNTGQSGGLADADIDAPDAWETATGSTSIIVGIVDSGIDYRHPDLRANLYTNPGEDPWSNPDDPTTGNKIDDDGNGYIDDWKGYNFYTDTNDPYDENGHGTHVAGIVGAAGNNGVGVSGVCWQVRLLPLRFLDASGNGNVGDAIEAIEYGVRMGVRVFNNSWGGADKSTFLEEAVQLAHDHNALFVAAAGNDGVNTDTTPEYPACLQIDNVVSVAASDQGDQRALWGDDNDDNTNDCGFACSNAVAAVPGSNYGPASVDLAAPGKDIYSTVPGGYAVFSGTSMAAPFVSGAAALLLARNFSLTDLQLKQRLLSSVDPLSAFSGLTVTAGRLNLQKALAGLP